MIKRYDLFQIHLCGQQPRGELQETLDGEYVAFDDVAHLLAPLSSQDDVVNRVAKALASVDLSRSVNLTRLVDGVSEYTLTYGDGSEPLVFDDINDAYEHVRNRTRHAQAAAVTAALAPAPSDHVRGRPAGHCDDDKAWQQFSADYAHHPRANLGKGDMTDFALANALFMCDRNSLDLIVYQTAVKERIRWLSIQLAAALAAKTPSPNRIEDAAKHVFNAMRVAAKEAGVNAPAWTDRGNSTMQEEARSAAARILNTPASTQSVNVPTGEEIQKYRAALERIAGPQDCGCSPVCQCNSQESLEIEVDALRDIALAALSSTPVIMNDEGKSKTPSPAQRMDGDA